MLLPRIVMNRPRQTYFNLLLRLLSSAAVMLLLGSTPLWAESFTLKVKHEHVRGSSRGELTINNEGVSYRSANTKEQRQWTYDNIQEIQFLSGTNLHLVSYEDSRWRFGGDRIYKFEVTEGTIPGGLISFVTSRFPKPVSDRIPTRSVAGLFEFPVKHLHRTGGCEGNLIIAEEGISFISHDAKDSRFWRYPDLESVGTSGPYDLRLGTYEHGPLQYGDTKEFRFQLKVRLNEAAYRFVWSHINELPAWHSSAQNKESQ